MIAAHRRVVAAVVAGFLVMLLAYAPSEAQTWQDESRSKTVVVSRQPPRLGTLASLPPGPDCLEGLGSRDLLFVVDNQGKGTARGVRLSLSTAWKGLSLAGEVPVGDVAPGARVERRVTVRASKDVVDGRARILVKTLERFDNFAPDVEIVLPVCRIDAPSLDVVETRVQDGTSGFARGNGNGVIENGESVEVVVRLRNAGPGEARTCAVTLTSLSPGVEIVKGETETVDLLPKAVSDETFALRVPRAYAGREITGTVTIAEGRGLGMVKKVLTLPYQRRAPQLTVAPRVYWRGSGQGSRTLDLGETVDLDVEVRNEGNLDAVGVSVSVAAGDETGLDIRPRQVGLGVIPAGSASKPARFTVTALASASSGPRTFIAKAQQSEFDEASAPFGFDVSRPGTRVVTARPAVAPAPAPVGGPVVLIHVPANGEKVASGLPVRVRGEVRAPSVRRLEVRVNGRSVPVDASSLRDNWFDVPVTVGAGRAEIVVTAFDGSNREGTDTVVVDGGDALLPLLPPATRAASDPDAWAIVIGVQQYSDVFPPPAKYARQDAEAMAEHLERLVGVPRDNIRLLLDAQATRSRIGAAIGRVKERITERSRVFVYFSGHGIAEPRTGLSGNASALLPADYAADSPELAYPVAQLYADLGVLRQARQVIVLLEACFSGGGDRSVAFPGARPVVPVYENAIPAERNTLALVAADSRQFAWVHDAVQHGLFTYYLLKGLQGAADADRDGGISVGELFEYIRGPVTQASRALPQEQVPKLLLGSGSGPVSTAWVVPPGRR